MWHVRFFLNETLSLLSGVLFVLFFRRGKKSTYKLLDKPQFINHHARQTPKQKRNTALNFFVDKKYTKKLKTVVNPTEPCTRRNGTLLSRAALYVQLYCSQRLTACRDKSTAQARGGLQTIAQFISSSFNQL